MSKTSFKIYCIEHYSEYKHISGDVIYKTFKNSGILNILDCDYDDLHGTGKEFLMDYLDRLLNGLNLCLCCEDTVIEKTELRIAIVPMIIDLIIKKQNVNEFEALDLFYTSKTYKNYIDTETGLYGQSPLNIYGWFLV